MQIGNILVFIPILPEIVDCLSVVYPDLHEDYIGDIGSALYNGFYALGAIIGPLISGFIVSGFGFPNGSAYLGILLLAFSAFYFFFAKVLVARKLVRSSSNEEIVSPEVKKALEGDDKT